MHVNLRLLFFGLMLLVSTHDLSSAVYVRLTPSNFDIVAKALPEEELSCRYNSKDGLFSVLERNVLLAISNIRCSESSEKNAHLKLLLNNCVQQENGLPCVKKILNLLCIDLLAADLFCILLRGTMPNILAVLESKKIGRQHIPFLNTIFSHLKNKNGAAFADIDNLSSYSKKTQSILIVMDKLNKVIGKYRKQQANHPFDKDDFEESCLMDAFDSADDDFFWSEVLKLTLTDKETQKRVLSYRRSVGAIQYTIIDKLVAAGDHKKIDLLISSFDKAILQSVVNVIPDSGITWLTMTCSASNKPAIQKAVQLLFEGNLVVQSFVDAPSQQTGKTVLDGAQAFSNSWLISLLIKYGFFKPDYIEINEDESEDEYESDGEAESEEEGVSEGGFGGEDDILDINEWLDSLAELDMLDELTT